VRRRAKQTLSLGRWIAKRRAKKLDPGTREELAARIDSLAAALRSKDAEGIWRDGARLAELLDGKLKPLRPSELWSTLRLMAGYTAFLLFVGIVFIQHFEIPSGSMLPTLEVGDRVFVSKFAYGLRVPLTYTPPRKLWRGREVRRGEVVVFLHPNEPERIMVKRAIAVSGDEVRFRGRQIWLRRRGERDFAPIPRIARGELRVCDKNERLQRWRVLQEPAFEEHLGDATYLTLGASEPPEDGFRDALAGVRRHTDAPVRATDDTFGPIPEGHTFMVVDNRERSLDSRYWGTVPYDYLMGPGLFVFFSWGASPDVECSETGMRFGRTFRRVD
jgi:signal peptidase I